MPSPGPHVMEPDDRPPAVAEALSHPRGAVAWIPPFRPSLILRQNGLVALKDRQFTRGHFVTTTARRGAGGEPPPCRACLEMDKRPGSPHSDGAEDFPGRSSGPRSDTYCSSVERSFIISNPAPRQTPARNDTCCGYQLLRIQLHLTGPRYLSNQASVSLTNSFRGGMWSVS